MKKEILKYFLEYFYFIFFKIIQKCLIIELKRILRFVFVRKIYSLFFRCYKSHLWNFERSRFSKHGNLTRETFWFSRTKMATDTGQKSFLEPSGFQLVRISLHFQKIHLIPLLCKMLTKIRQFEISHVFHTLFSYITRRFDEKNFNSQFQRKRKRKNGVVGIDEFENSSFTDLNSTSETKRKKTLSKFTSFSALATPMAKAFKRSVSHVRLSGSPAPPPPPSFSAKSTELPTTPGKFGGFMRSASVVKVLQHHNSNTPESPLLKRSGLGRNSSTNLTPYK